MGRLEGASEREDGEDGRCEGEEAGRIGGVKEGKVGRFDGVRERKQEG